MKSILVVEDDHSIRLTIRETLEHEGYCVLSAANGRDGLEILKKNRPNLVLLDLNMPVMDGYEFLAEYRGLQDCSEIPVVVLSASGDLNAPLGAREYFPKPFEIDSLLGIAKKHCEMARAAH